MLNAFAVFQHPIIFKKKNAQIFKAVNEQLVTEALRVIEKMPDWTARIFDGEVVGFYFILSVVFAL